MHLARPLMRAGVAVAAVALAASGLAQPASAHNRHGHHKPHKPVAKTLVSDLVSPLTIAVDHRGAVYSTQNFTGTLTKYTPGRPPRVLYQSTTEGAEVGGVSVRGDEVTFTITAPDMTTTLMQYERGVVTELASLSDHESTENPDAEVAYGFGDDLPVECAAQFPPDFPASYTGIVESHPYATLTVGRTTYVADAAANAILAVRGDQVRTVAALPSRPETVTAEAASANGLPECTAGYEYAFEFVPTDLAMGKDGKLVVTSLPGGPEDDSLGARGSVWKVDPWSGRAKPLAKGFLGATGVAVGKQGEVYVSELFGNRISVVKRGSHHAKKFIALSMPAAVEWTPKGLYATADALTGLSGEPGDVPAGKVVRIR